MLMKICSIAAFQNNNTTSCGKCSKYALEENTETCYIFISVKQCGHDICITVKNTGSEFEDNIIEKLRNAMLYHRALELLAIYMTDYR